MPTPSRRRLTAPLASGLLVALGLAIGCTSQPSGPDQRAALPTTSPSTGPQPGATASPGTRETTSISFQTQVAPLLSDRCAACHAGSGAGGVTLFDGGGNARYSSIKARIGSIIAEVSSGQMPRNAPRLTAGEIELLESWSSAGAPNN